MSWSEDGIERKRDLKREKEQEKERIERERKSVFLRAVEAFFSQYKS